VKRLAVILFAVLVLQLTGLRGICSPPPQLPQDHDCCPAEGGAPAPSSQLPECCLVTSVRQHGAVVQKTAESADSVQTHLPASGATPLAVRPATVHQGTVQTPRLEPSPPISPLHQTCLLLI
jgi:hypothetical protein